MNVKEQLTAVQQACQAIIDGAKSSNRELTDAEVRDLEAKSTEALELKGRVDRAEKAAGIMHTIETMNSGTEAEGASDGQYLAFTGKGAKAAARRIAGEIVAKRGAKAFLESGVEVTDTPLESQSPMEAQRIPTSILEVLRTTVRTSPTWKYLRQTAFVNNAAIVARGAEKPESIITVGEETGELQVIAHLSEALDKYMLADNASLTQFISGQLLYGIARKLEAEVLSGAGTTGHFTGLLNTSGVQTQAFATDRITTLRTAATKLEVLGHNADVFLLHPNDWAAIETTRATSGTFDLGGPIDRAQRRVWGTQVVTSTGLPAGTALALDLDAATVDRDNRGVQVEWDKSGDLFTHNQIRARVEGRFGLSVYRPEAIVKVSLASA